MKRSISDSDTDVFYDERDLIKAVGSPSQSCHRSDRKRRRGVIEKRRRDRINNSLTELRRLVPAAFEKQDSAKLEKAEILQMTVDHLKSMHAKGVSGYNLDTTVLALDYRTVGFRECAAEVARYLISVEGLDIQDPLRLRLMSHLQCYCAQREAAARASLQNSTWGHQHLATAAGPSHGQYGNGAVGASTMVQQQQQQHPSQAEHLAAAAAHSSTLSSYMDSGRANHPQTGEGGNHGSGGMTVMRLQPSGVTMGSQIASTSTGQMAAPVLSGLPSVHSQFLGVNSVAMLSPNSFHYNVNMSNQSVKPYRPWGSELVY